MVISHMVLRDFFLFFFFDSKDMGRLVLRICFLLFFGLFFDFFAFFFSFFCGTAPGSKEMGRFSDST